MIEVVVSSYPIIGTLRNYVSYIKEASPVKALDNLLGSDVSLIIKGSPINIKKTILTWRSSVFCSLYALSVVKKDS